MTRVGDARSVGIAALGGLLLLAVPTHAASIKMEDGTTVNGEILQLDDDQVIIGLSRPAVSTVNGKPLPPTLKEGVAAPAFSAKDLQGNPQAVGGANGRVTLLHF